MPKLRLVLLTGAAALFAQTPVPNDLQNGLAALQAAKYEEAVRLLQQAVHSSPSNPNAHLYLATAYMRQYIPGVDTVENDQLAIDAERAFRGLLALQPANIHAMESLATLHQHRATGKQPSAEKMRALDDSAYWNGRILSIAPDHKTAHYNLGVIAWMKFFPELMQARAKLGMKPEDPGPLSDAGVRTDLRGRMGHIVEDGIKHLHRALEIDPAYDDAMAYLNLLYRERGDLADSVSDWERDTRIGDSWVERALQTKRLKAEQQVQIRGGGSGAANVRMTVSGTLVTPPPPPPPPPPPAPPTPGVN